MGKCNTNQEVLEIQNKEAKPQRYSTGKIGRIASEDVIVQLLKTKCLPVLYYCLEACPRKKYQLDAIDFVLNSTFRKTFSTRSQEVVVMCKQIFGCQTPSDVVANRKCKFFSKFVVSDNTLCHAFKNVAMVELTLLTRAVS